MWVLQALRIVQHASIRGYRHALAALTAEVKARIGGSARVACVAFHPPDTVGDEVPEALRLAAERAAWSDASKNIPQVWAEVAVIPLVAQLPEGALTTRGFPLASLIVEQPGEAAADIEQLAALAGETLLLALDGGGLESRPGMMDPAAFRRLTRRWTDVARARDLEVSMFVVAVDGLAEINDDSGFEVGDAALDEVFAFLVREQPATAMSPLGGALTAVLLAGTGRAEAAAAAARLASRFETVTLPKGVTLSIGVATVRELADEELLRAARSAMLAARQQRSGIVLWQPTLVTPDTDDPLQDLDSVSNVDYQRMLTIWRLFEVLCRGPQLDQLIANTLRALLPLFRADRVALWQEVEEAWTRTTKIDRTAAVGDDLTTTALIAEAARSTEVVQHRDSTGIRVIAISLRRGDAIAGVIEIARHTGALRVESGELEFLITFARRIGRVIGEVQGLAEARRRQQETADRLRQQTIELRRLVRTSSGLLGNDASMQLVFRMIERSKASSYPVVITGETGTGKEAVARLVHRMSNRRGPFVVVDCGAIPAGLLESELFGHEKGAFTGADSRKIGRFEEAAMGTIFLDEIGELPLELQPKLLRVLQEQSVRRLGGRQVISVDFRMIAATHRDLAAMVEEGTFRQDLYFRLRVLEIHLPPLRERGDDILLLALHSLRQYCAELGREMMTISPDAEALMRAYAWPGNVRELQNLLRRAVLVAQGNEIMPRDLNIELGTRRALRAAPAVEAAAAAPEGLDDAVARWFWQAWVEQADGAAPPQDAIEAFLLRTCIQLSGGSIGKAAALLDMHSETFIAHLDKLGDPQVSKTIRHHALAAILERSLVQPGGPELRDRILRVLLTELLVYCRGNKSEMARHLGWGRQTLARQLKRLDVIATPSTAVAR